MRGKPNPAPFQSLDLFGHMPVTRADVRLWLLRVARLDPDSPRAAYYVKVWNVTAKIAAAKSAGAWPPTI